MKKWYALQFDYKATLCRDWSTFNLFRSYSLASKALRKLQCFDPYKTEGFKALGYKRLFAPCPRVVIYRIIKVG